MSPRRYSMSVRAEQAAQTRERIIDAALSCYRETGIAATSLQAVARRAEVSAATILNHFGSANGLARIVIAVHVCRFSDQVFDQLLRRIPDIEADSLARRERRIRLLFDCRL